jgi:hypothetical protein
MLKNCIFFPIFSVADPEPHYFGEAEAASAPAPTLMLG